MPTRKDPIFATRCLYCGKSLRCGNTSGVHSNCRNEVRAPKQCKHCGKMLNSRGRPNRSGICSSCAGKERYIKLKEERKNGN